MKVKRRGFLGGILPTVVSSMLPGGVGGGYKQTELEPNHKVEPEKFAAIDEIPPIAHSNIVPHRGFFYILPTPSSPYNQMVWPKQSIVESSVLYDVD